MKIDIVDPSPQLPGNVGYIVSAQVRMAQETENRSLEPSIVREGVRHIFEHPEKGFWLVALDREPFDSAFLAESRVGTLLITYDWSDWTNKPMYWLQSLWVEPEYRRKGVFEQMLGVVKSRMVARDVTSLRLYVDESNVAAQEAYDALGIVTGHYQMRELELDRIHDPKLDSEKG